MNEKYFLISFSSMLLNMAFHSRGEAEGRAEIFLLSHCTIHAAD
jgi:hypothetical protein